MVECEQADYSHFQLEGKHANNLSEFLVRGGEVGCYNALMDKPGYVYVVPVWSGNMINGHFPRRTEPAVLATGSTHSNFHELRLL